MRKVIADRNRRVTNAVQEATKRKKAEERARRAADAAEAKRQEEEERARLREAQASQRTRESLPREASSTSRSRYEGAEMPNPRRLNVRVSSEHESDAASRQAEEPAEAPPAGDEANANAEVRPEAGAQQQATVDEIIEIGRTGVRPQPRRQTTATTAPFQDLLDGMRFPVADETEVAELFTALFENQRSLAQQNALLMRAVQNKNEVKLKVSFGFYVYVNISSSGCASGTSPH